MCIVLDGYLSPYYAGVNLVILAAGALFPWDAKRILIAVSCIFGTYIVAMLVDAGFHIQVGGVLINNIYFLFATAVISVASASVADRRRRAAFTQLVEL